MEDSIGVLGQTIKSPAAELSAKTIEDLGRLLGVAIKIELSELEGLLDQVGRVRRLAKRENLSWYMENINQLDWLVTVTQAAIILKKSIDKAGSKISMLGAVAP